MEAIRALLSEGHEVRNEFKVYQVIRMLPKLIKSDIETFLISLEKRATTNDWPPRDKHLAIIQTQMSRNALQIFNEVPTDITYEEAKEKLLLAYYVVPETYRKQFRSQTKSNDQTFSEHAFNLNTLFKRWLVGIDAYDNLESFREAMLLARFFETFPDDLKIWIVDRNAKSVIEAAQMADTYCVNHTVYSSKVTKVQCLLKLNKWENRYK